MYFSRKLESIVPGLLRPGKVVLILGARRVGKTVFVNQLLKSYENDILLLNGEDAVTARLLAERSIAHYRHLIGSKTLLVIDEAQKIPEIGAIAKLMIDHLPKLRILLTGSSCFDLNHQLGEPLTGRKNTVFMYPLSVSEFMQREDYVQVRSNLAERMVFGCYPEVWHYQDRTARIAYLKELATDYLLKDILQYEGIRNASKLSSLLRLVAFQIGKQVSYDELGRQLGLNKNTVEKYLDLLTKVFVLYKVEGFSRNLRKEISKSSRWYFLDTGIRNLFAANFNDLALRPDGGELWENYCISERLKWINYNNHLVNYYFWRTYDQQEIDWVEESGGKLNGYELKWAKSKSKVPAAWRKAYPNAGYEIIHPDNYLDWLSE